MTSPALSGLTVGVLMAEGADEQHHSALRRELEARGAISMSLTGDSADAAAADLDALVIVGGDDPAAADPVVRRLVAYFVSNDRPLAALGHGAALLAEAGVVKRRTIAGPPQLRSAFEEAGARWASSAVARDGMLVTGRGVQEMEPFVAAVVSLLATRSAVVDAAIADSFPASDPPATGGGPGIGQVGAPTARETARRAAG